MTCHDLLSSFHGVGRMDVSCYMDMSLIVHVHRLVCLCLLVLQTARLLCVRDRLQLRVFRFLGCFFLFVNTAGFVYSTLLLTFCVFEVLSAGLLERKTRAGPRNVRVIGNRGLRVLLLLLLYTCYWTGHFASTTVDAARCA